VAQVLDLVLWGFKVLAQRRLSLLLAQWQHKARHKKSLLIKLLKK
jgi:hypothetical protein